MTPYEQIVCNFEFFGKMIYQLVILRSKNLIVVINNNFLYNKHYMHTCFDRISAKL